MNLAESLERVPVPNTYSRRSPALTPESFRTSLARWCCNKGTQHLLPFIRHAELRPSAGPLVGLDIRFSPLSSLRTCPPRDAFARGPGI